MARKIIGTIDCETDPFVHGETPRPFIWGCLHDGTYYQTESTKEIIEFISKLENTILYAHNGGKFDFHFMIQWLNPDAKIRVINNRLVSFCIGSCELRDSYSIIPAALGAYEKTHIDYNKMHRDERQKHMPEIKAYLRDDCVLLHELIMVVRKEYGTGLTIAGNAYKLWSRKFAKRTPVNSTEPFYNRYSKFYFGGRTEVFKGGKIDYPCESYDINSAYPCAMMENIPYQITAPLQSKTLPDDHRLCLIKLDCVSQGALPFRDDKKGVTFPNDNLIRRYHVCAPEFIAAVELGLLSRIRIHKVWQFTETINFREYVTHFWDLKNTAKNKADRLVAKLYLNSLYGKFAANPDKYKNYFAMPCEYLAEIGRVKHTPESERNSIDKIIASTGFVRGINSDYYLSSCPVPDYQKTYYNIVTAAWITSLVRAKLLRAINSVSIPIYCDTDSVTCRDRGALIVGNDELGSWETEGKYKGGFVGGKKMYAFAKTGGGWKKASKGAQLSALEIAKLSAGKEIIYHQPAPCFSMSRNEPRKIVRKLVRTY